MLEKMQTKEPGDRATTAASRGTMRHANFNATLLFNAIVPEFRQSQLGFFVVFFFSLSKFFNLFVIVLQFSVTVSFIMLIDAKTKDLPSFDQTLLSCLESFYFYQPTVDRSGCEND